MPLDTLVTGRIATLAGATGFGWVEAIGIRDGRVAFAGSEVDLETRADPHTRRIALEPDEVAIPGLTDAHLHLAQAAAALRQVDLSAAATLEAGMAAVGAAHDGSPRTPTPGSTGTAGTPTGGAAGRRRRPRGGRAGPPRHPLGARPPRAAREPRRPRDGAASRRDTRIPPAASIRRDARGRPGGVLYESATRLVTVHRPAAGPRRTSRPTIVTVAGTSCVRSASSRATTPARSPPTRT